MTRLCLAVLLRASLFALALLMLTVDGARAATVVLPVTEDTGISSERGHFADNSGVSVTIPIRQNQNWSGFETKAALLRFDAAPARGLSVERAWLNIFLARGDLYGIGLATVLADWEEGAGLNGETGRGGASWNWAREPQDPAHPAAGDWWTWPGSQVYSAAWAHPDVRYSHAGPGQLEKTELAHGLRRLRIPVDPQVVEALAAGLASGLLLTDDKGQVAEAYSLKGTGMPYRYDLSQDIWMYTREVSDSTLRPFLEVEGQALDRTAPGAVGEPAVSGSDPFDPAVTVSFLAPAEDGSVGGAALGYEAAVSREVILSEQTWEQAEKLPRWAIPLPEAPAVRQELRVFTLAPGRYSLAIRAVDEAGNRGALSTVEIEVPEKATAALAAPPAPSREAGRDPAVYDNRLEVWACPDLCKVDPVSGGILFDSENYRPAGEFSRANEVWEGGRRTISLAAAAGEVVAAQLLLGRVGEGSLTGIRVVPSELTGPGGTIRAAEHWSAYRLWYLDVEPRQAELVGPWELVEEKDHRPAWHGDACLPLAAPFADSFDLPSMDNMGPEQRWQSVWLDLFVPPTARAGSYEGTVTVTARELRQPATLTVRLEVLPLRLPQTISWSVELNAYHYGIPLMFGVEPKQDLERFLAIERRCYQLAHQHRATLNILPYGQDGSVQYAAAPELTGQGAGLEVSDWSRWDHRYGGYLDGKAFTRAAGYRGPCQGAPLTHLYLPFHENWPLPIRDYYADYADVGERLQLAEWAKTSRPLEEAFGQEYRQGFVSVTRQCFEHFRKKGWDRTAFQVYYNNKYYFKANFFRMPNEGRGSSFWLLDEPVDYDDYAANRFFLGLSLEGFRQAVGDSRMQLHLRTDVSQPEMSRGLWDGLCNLWNSSGIYDFGTTARFRMQRLSGEGYYHYGGGPAIAGRLVDLPQNFLSCWSLGTVGDLPYWNNLGGFSWFNPDDLAIFYTGRDYGRGGKSYDGPLASVRLKAMRRGQQDIEYLNLLAQRPGWGREKVRAALQGWADDSAGAVPRFRELTPQRLSELRRAVVEALLER